MAGEGLVDQRPARAFERAPHAQRARGDGRAAQHHAPIARRGERLAAQEHQGERAPREPTEPPIGCADPRVQRVDTSDRGDEQHRQQRQPEHTRHAFDADGLQEQHERRDPHDHRGHGPACGPGRDQTVRIDRDHHADEERGQRQRERAPTRGRIRPRHRSRHHRRRPGHRLHRVRQAISAPTGPVSGGAGSLQYTPQRHGRFPASGESSRHLSPWYQDVGRKLWVPSAYSPRTASYGSRRSP